MAKIIHESFVLSLVLPRSIFRHVSSPFDLSLFLSLSVPLLIVPSRRLFVSRSIHLDSQQRRCHNACTRRFQHLLLLPFFSPLVQPSDFDESVRRSISRDDSIGSRPRNVDEQEWRGAHVPPHFQFHFIKRDCPSQNA